MEADFKKPFFSRALLAGVFTGFIVTLLDLSYNVFYREMNGYSQTLLINVSSIIFTTMTVSLIIGFIFFAFASYIRNGRLLFSIFLFVLTLFCVGLTLNFHFQHGIPFGFDGLFCGLLIMTGFLLAIFVPYFAKHSDIFI